MKKEDVIHYYMGAEAEFDGRKGKITKVSIQNNNPLVRISWTSEYNRYIDAWASEIKLLLRPLSSMTEEEAKDFILITHAVNREQIKCAEARKNQLEFRIDDTYGEIQWSQLSSLEFVYLIQSGYDMFQFISRGLAIDITKLNKNEG